MKKIIISIVLLFSVCGSAFGIYNYIKNMKELEALRSSTWTVDEVKDMTVQGMTIDNDSLMTDALTALIIRKIENGNADCSLGMKISDSQIDMGNLKTLMVRISNGDLSITDTLGNTEIDGHSISGSLHFTGEEILKVSTQSEETLQYILSLCKKEELKIEVNPDFGNGETEWLPTNYK
ncbi:MAG: hypothetical protein MJZ23_07305 [Paludibacteraceae bacterium]|nr:hypothetical protein [Paludibacteraceae bacterium]